MNGEAFGAAEHVRLRENEALIEGERELLAELSTERLLPLILERAGALVNAEGTIYLAERGGGWLRPIWSTSPTGGFDGVPVGEGISGVCAETRQGLLVPDYRGWAKAYQPYVAPGVRTAISQPLVSRGDLLGVITTSRMAPEASPFESRDLDILQRFARQAALALRNATPYGALLESEARYRDLFENATDPMATATLDGVLTNVNRAMEQLLGYSREELIGGHHSLVTMPAASTQAEEPASRPLAGERPPEIWGSELRHKSGKNLVRRGSVRRIVAFASRLEADGRYASFTAEVRKLVERLQLKPLCQFLEAARRHA